MFKKAIKSNSKNKMMEAAKRSKLSAQKFTSEDGNQKIVAFVSANSQNANIFINSLIMNKDFLISSKNEKMTSLTYRKNGMKFLYICADGLTCQEFSLLCNYTDITVLLSDSSFNLNQDIELLSTKSSTLLYCVDKREEVKKIPASEMYKVISKDMLMMMLIKMGNDDNKKRPILIPNSIHFGDDGGLIFETFLEQGLISRYFVGNGNFNFEISQIVDGDVIYGPEIFEENENIKYDLRNLDYEKQENEVNCDSEDTDSMSEPIDEENGEDNLYLTEKYREYEGIHDFSNATYITRQKPEYFNNLTFLRNYKAAEGRCFKQHKRLLVGKRVSIRFKPVIGLSSNILILVNLYNLELEKSIYNVYFTSKDKIVENEELTFDTGVRTFTSKVLLSESGNFTLYKTNESLFCGIMTFIGPITLGLQRLNIYRYGEISSKAHCAKGAFHGYNDRIMVEEVVLEGSPYKINKRHAYIRHMFTNRNDVLNFKLNEICAGKANIGKIKEPIGTHGLFKAFFNRPVLNTQKVKMCLYRAVFPEDMK